MRHLLLLLLLLSTTPATALDGVYTVEGSDARGSYRGTAQVTPLRGEHRRLELQLPGQTIEAVLTPQGPAFQVAAADRTAQAQAVEGGWLLRWWDRSGRLLGDERWSLAIVIDVAVVAVGPHGALAGLDADEARRGQAEVLARLTEVYGPLGLRFRAWRDAPSLVPGAGCDRDADGRLSRDEVERLRDRLEAKGIKRPGRVVVALTRAPFVGHGARGWTLGDAPRTPATLEDLNDNFSLIGLDHVGPGEHTVAHEVGHQFGLDDLGAQNAPVLSQPWREDHLMHSGGEGSHLDPAVVERLQRWVRYADSGLGGRRAIRPLEPAPASARAGQEGLGAPPAAFHR